jgi:hypothetical protein
MLLSVLFEVALEFTGWDPCNKVRLFAGSLEMVGQVTSLKQK